MGISGLWKVRLVVSALESRPANQWLLYVRQVLEPFYEEETLQNVALSRLAPGTQEDEHGFVLRVDARYENTCS